MEGEARDLSDCKVRENIFALSIEKSLPGFSVVLSKHVHGKNREGNGRFRSDLSLKNRISPLRVLIASKDRLGSHAAGVSGPGGTGSGGTAGSSGETEGDPAANGWGRQTEGQL